MFDEILNPYEAEDEYMTELEYLLKLINEQLDGINEELRELNEEVERLEISVQNTLNSSEQ